MRAAAAWCCFQMLLGGGAVSLAADTVRLDKALFLDKCRGAWAGQMIGVSFGAPTEWAPGVIGFIWMARPNDSELAPWTPDRISNALQQDDVYVEMTFLKAMEDHGIDISPKQAGLAFAASEYDLWHANLFGRENIRRGIMPPRSGHPKYNLHVNDIDFQIEADLFGIVCPGLPRESNRLCDRFGHIMCYGDGVYGGMFVAGMYAAAYFEDCDVRAVVEAGLACIPAKSSYHRCISDVLRWHDEHPEDWLATWHKVEAKWQDNKDCEPYLLSNINANLNGAYVVMGMLYGNGDMGRTIEVATRCGQDSDCNPSTAAGVLGCMKGLKAIDPQWISGLTAIEDKKFDYTGYSFKTLIPASQHIAEEVIRKAGGSVEADAYLIPRQTPRAPHRLEQWENDAGGIFEPVTTKELKLRTQATGAAKE
ncbi:MAG: ADP-ribosylglycohydrolase family protein [Candidatus Hydrogenedentales bacterium]